MRLTDREAVRRALHFAIEWEISLIQAYDHSGAYHRDAEGNLVRGPDADGMEVIDGCQKNIAAFKRVLARYFGDKHEPLPLKGEVEVYEFPERKNAKS